ncbi:transporter associated domain-containing protein [Treponema vincentii]|uniref:transporter associated domain-containing protein n=1 Tax=Treponema vincentii TaxID=69710 RepID=UPI001E34725F|nr:transporter associated domain-containing protein [Treponema vincentii]
MFARFGAIPHPGDSIDIGSSICTVLSMHGQRIDQVAIKKKKKHKRPHPLRTASLYSILQYLRLNIENSRSLAKEYLYEYNQALLSIDTDYI